MRSSKTKVTILHRTVAAVEKRFNMKFSRRMPRPTRRIGRISLILLVCGVFCIAFGWTYVLISFPTS